MGMLLVRHHWGVSENMTKEADLNGSADATLVEEVEAVEEVEETPKYKKWEITHMTTADVTKVAKAEGLKVKDKSGAKIKEELIKHFNL